MTPQEVPNAAADLLESGRVEWIQGALFRLHDGTVPPYDRPPKLLDAKGCCAEGAIRLCAPTRGLVYDALEAFSVDTPEAFDVSVADFNDTPGRTKAEVISALRAAAIAPTTEVP